MTQPWPPKYPPHAYRGFRPRLPDWLIGLPTAADQSRAVRLLGLRHGDCSLDPACGSGFNLRRLALAVGPSGIVFAVEDNPGLLQAAAAKVERAGWKNVHLLDSLRRELVTRQPVDGMIVSYNPPIVLQRRDLLEEAWSLLKPRGRIALVAGRCTTPTGRLAGPLVRAGLWLFGHAADWHYWTVHEPWQSLQELAGGNLEVETRLGFQYLLWAEKPD